MIVRNYHDSRDTERHVVTDGWESVRLLLKDDKMGFSFHITTIFAGKQLEMRYANHLEAVFCISGKGSIIDRNTGEIHEIGPGTMYALDRNDPHILTGKSDMVLACVFNPPVTGREVHDDSGAYPLDSDVETFPVAAV